ncbi:hypothetical protein ACWCXH_11865 [Kitasatospora sp. NPDC001660]
MDESAAEWPGTGLPPEGRMSEQDAERFRRLLAGLESSLASDREAVVARRDG